MRHRGLRIPLIVLLLATALPVPAQQPALIDLYPDPLVGQVFLASTYPLEIVQAARFMRGNANLNGDAPDAAWKNQPWGVDQALTKFNPNDAWKKV